MRSTAAAFRPIATASRRRSGNASPSSACIRSSRAATGSRFSREPRCLMGRRRSTPGSSGTCEMSVACSVRRTRRSSSLSSPSSPSRSRLHRSRRWRSVVPWGLLLGSLLTIGIAVLAVPVILLGFDGFFLRFHEVFFNGDTWRFSETDTLLRIYPETFWQDTAKLAAAIVVAQAIVVGLAAGWWIRRIRPVSPVAPRRRARRDRPPRPSRRRPAHRSSRRGDARSREHARARSGRRSRWAWT